MGARVRPIAVMVTVEAVLDDGETLTPLQIAPIRLTAAQMDEFDLGDQIANVQAQIDAAAESAP